MIMEMPPDGKLAADQIASLTKWIEMGAPWPGHDGSVRQPAASKPKITDEDRAYWAFQPLRDDPPPTVSPDGWVRNDLDRFVLAKLEVAGVKFGSLLKGEPKAKWEQLQRELAQFNDLQPQELPPAFTATDVGPVAPPTLMPSGREQRQVEPGFLTILAPGAAEIVPPPSGNSTGRRTALSRWLTSPDNPLTARVMVNRIWQQHFGVGLVATASDFGRLGEPPSHPELLDWLARRFIGDGWRLKPLQRLIVTSAAYRQAAAHPDSELARRKDPENRWLWRMNVRRLDAEQIRDAMLAVSGELDLTAGGPSVDLQQPRRSVYTKALRNTKDPLLDAFDAADPFSSTDRRNVTTTPTQSLLMINGPWPLKRAEALATRLRKQHAADEAALGAQAYRLAYGRRPEPAEAEAASRFLRERSASEAMVGSSAAEQSEFATAALIDFCHALLNSNEFLYTD